MSVTDRGHLSIGEVLSLLQAEFPDVTISKIRFLESQGLIDPERTPSGYRKFYEPDIDRLRWILVQQRDHFLPLKVIKDRIEEAIALELPLGGSDPTEPPAGIVAPAAGAVSAGLSGSREPAFNAFTGRRGADGAASSPADVPPPPAADTDHRVQVLGPSVDAKAAGTPGHRAGPSRPAGPGLDRNAGSVLAPVGGGGDTGADLRDLSAISGSGHDAHPPEPLSAPADAALRSAPPETAVGHGAARHEGSSSRPEVDADPAPRATARLGGGEHTQPAGPRPPALGGQVGPSMPGGLDPAEPGQEPAGSGTGPDANADTGPAGATRGGAIAGGDFDAHVELDAQAGPLGAGYADLDGSPAAANGMSEPAAEADAIGPDRPEGGSAGGGPAASVVAPQRRSQGPGRDGGAPPSGAIGPIGSGRWRATPRRSRASDVSSASFTAEELVAAVGMTLADLEELERFGLISSRPVAQGRRYGDDAVLVAGLALRFRAYGLEARHLRMFRVAVDRELALYEQIITPLTRSRGESGEVRAAEIWSELDQLGANLRDALFHRGEA